MQNFRITYNNGHVQIVTAQRYRADGWWIIFEDSEKHEVHRINERDVQRIAPDDAGKLPGPTSA